MLGSSNDQSKSNRHQSLLGYFKKVETEICKA